MSTAIRLLLLSLLIGLVWGCAQQTSLTGGDKDVTPPKILSSEPLNESTNYRGNSIALEFDEYVQLKNANSELIVSPPLENPIEFKMKGKKVLITWDELLDDSTTYLFQFGKGITDFNEGNQLDSNVFVFSTGSFIDSMELRGKVINAEDLKPAEEVWVMLYQDDYDSLPYKELPKYFAKTDKSGNYMLRYLQPGEYKIFALKSTNAGYLFDIPDENIGFLSEKVKSYNPKDSMARDTQYVLSIFQQIDSTQFIKKFDQIETRGLTFIFNRPVDSFSYTDLTGISTSAWIPAWNVAHDSVALWFDANLEYDSLKIQVNADAFRDTIFFKKPSLATKAKRGGKAAEDANKLNLKPSTTSKQPYYKTFKAKSVTPITQIKGIEDWIFIQNGDTLKLNDNVTQTFYGFEIKYPWKQDAKYQIIIKDSLISDRYGRWNDTIKWSFTASRKEDYGQLTIKHILPELGHPFVWQLLTADSKLVEETILQPSGSISYNYLPTGSYKIKLIFDVNSNGKWDPGYYPRKRQPEKIIFYDGTIEVRSNWATDLEWNLLPSP